MSDGKVEVVFILYEYLMLSLPYGAVANRVTDCYFTLLAKD